MSEFGVVNLEEMQGEDSRLSVEGVGDFLAQFVQVPECKPGKTVVFPVRVLPPVRGGKLFQYTRLHLINGRKYHCPKPLVNGKWSKDVPCAVCDYYNSLWRQIDKLEAGGRKAEAEQLKKEARAIKPIERYYYNVVCRKVVDEKGEHTNVGPKIWSIGKVIHKMVVRAIVGDEQEAALGDITHPKNGYDFIIRKEMRGAGDDAWPNYDRSSFAGDASPLGTAEEIGQWVDGLYDLTKYRVPAEAAVLEKQLAVHRGLIPDEKDEFDVDKFDEKWKGGKPVNASRNVAEDTTQEPRVTQEVPVEDIQIDDSEFLNTLESLKANH